MAFANRKGVSLLDPQLRGLRTRRGCRLLLTSVFGGGATGSTTPAVEALHQRGVDFRVLNLPGGTYHPKMYLTRSGTSSTAVIGSANLTSGLLGNIEAGVRLRGPDQWEPMRQAWELGEDLWRHPLARPWEPSDSEPDEPLDSALLAALEAVLPIGGSFPTLGQGKPNRVMSVSPAGLTVETQTSISKGVPPQPVEAWMLELAWTALQERGILTYNELTNELHVHRSSVILAALAQPPNVIVTSTRRSRRYARRPAFQPQYRSFLIQPAFLARRVVVPIRSDPILPGATTRTAAFLAARDSDGCSCSGMATAGVPTNWPPKATMTANSAANGQRPLSSRLNLISPCRSTAI